MASESEKLEKKSTTGLIKREGSYAKIPWALISVVLLIWICYLIALSHYWHSIDLLLSHTSSPDTPGAINLQDIRSLFHAWIVFGLIDKVPLIAMTLMGIYWYHTLIREKLNEMHDHTHFAFREILQKIGEHLRKAKRESDASNERLFREIVQQVGKAVSTLNSAKDDISNDLIKSRRRDAAERKQWDEMVESENKRRENAAEQITLTLEKATQEILVVCERTISDRVPEATRLELDRYFDWTQ